MTIAQCSSIVRVLLGVDRVPQSQRLSDSAMREIAVWLCLSLTPSTETEVGDNLGLTRDKVHRGCERVRERMRTEVAYAQSMDSLRRAVLEIARLQFAAEPVGERS